MSEDWVSAQEALDILARDRDNIDLNARAIIKYASVGWVKSKAKLFVYQNQHEARERENFELPTFFWPRDNFELFEQDWPRSDFSNLINRIRQYAFGVTFDRAGIEAMLPTSIKSVRKSTAKAESDCQSWLSKEFVANPQDVRPKSAYWMDAKTEFPDLAGRAFDRVWAAVAPRHGRNLPGRKKSPH